MLRDFQGRLVGRYDPEKVAFFWIEERVENGLGREVCYMLRAKGETKYLGWNRKGMDSLKARMKELKSDGFAFINGAPPEDARRFKDSQNPCERDYGIARKKLDAPLLQILLGDQAPNLKLTTPMS